MTGKSHLACNISLAVAAGSALRIIEKKYNLIYSDRIVSFIQDTVYPFLTGRQALPMLLWWVLALGLYIAGSLLPDCDTKTSMLGRFVHLPFEHRTWTHTVWFLLPSIVFMWFFPIGFYLFAGIFLHLLLDAISYGGVCWFYPLSKYREYNGGAKVKAKHWCKIYRTGQTSEAVVDAVFVISAATVLAFCLLNRIYV